MARERGVVWLKQGAEAPPPLVDLDYLARLEGQLGRDVVAELLSDGRIELADRIARLRELARGANRAALAAVAHDLIAVAGHLGLTALSLAAADMHRAARLEHGPPPADLAGPVLDLGEPSLDAILALAGSARGG